MLTIRINLVDLCEKNTNLSLRHTLVATLEERGIGEVFDEGMGNDFMEVSLDIIPSVKKEAEIKAILRSLGILENSEFIYNEIEE